MNERLKKDLINYLLENIYENTDPELILGELYDIAVEAFEMVKRWKEGL